jgi:hypothetical protein
VGKRYRSLRREQRLRGGTIFFEDHHFPAQRLPLCDDEEICEWLESRSTFGTVITLVEDSNAELVVDPGKIPDGVNAENFSEAVKFLGGIGINVNPDLLEAKEEEPEPEGEQEAIPDIPLPTLTFVNTAKKSDLIAVVERFGWDDIDKNGHNVYLRDAIKEKVKALTPEEGADATNSGNAGEPD